MGVCGSKEEPSAPQKKTSRATQQTAGSSTTKTNGGVSTGVTTANVSNGSSTDQEKSADSGKQLTNVVNSTNNNTTTNNNNNSANGTDSNTTVVAKAKPEVKLLLLGSGESGKSTVLKQIKIIHQNGFTKRELYDYKPFVFKNILDCVHSIIKAHKQFDTVKDLKELSDADLEELLNFDIQMDTDYRQLDTEIVKKTKILVNEPATKRLFDEFRNEFYILDSAKYFFDNLDRISEPDYSPTVTDVLRTRKQTSGIYDIKFQLEDIEVHLYDVGGQRSERKKWIHCFDNVTVIMFCVALSEYDQVLLESSSQNRLEESLNLFESVVNSMWFRRTSIVLCLNKIDVFIEKLPHSPLEKYFPDYVGGNDVGKAVKYIIYRFKQVNRANLNIMPYVTQATDTSNIKLAFAVVKETIIHNALMDSGILQS